MAKYLLSCDDRLTAVLVRRGVTLKQHETKMVNLAALMKAGHKVIRAVRHDRYKVEGVAWKWYNPYLDTWAAPSFR